MTNVKCTSCLKELVGYFITDGGKRFFHQACFDTYKAGEELTHDCHLSQDSGCDACMKIYMPDEDVARQRFI